MSKSSTNNNTSFVEHSQDGLTYLAGFGNDLESECLKGALPQGRNNPRAVPYNLYCEQLSGTAFTAPRHSNRRIWLYRIQPSVVVSPTTTNESSQEEFFGQCALEECQPHVNPLRWKPMPLPNNDAKVDFVSGMRLQCSAGHPSLKNGLSIYMYACNADMKKSHASEGKDKHLYNADGDFLIVPQLGTLEINTELGRLHVAPTEICVIPRGIVFQVNLLDSTMQQQQARGYVLEIYKGGFQLPELGPIGSNGLANVRDFWYPTAWCVDKQKYNQPCTIVTKMQQQLFTKPSNHSPYNVVAWHGNYLPFKYDLKRFCAVNSVTYDHIDPSIYTVLTCQSDQPGTALADFVIFPPRYLSTDANTFRPPWFHRNTMSEYMGLIYGQYDAKRDFVPGGASLHNCMTPHGPDQMTYAKAVADPCETPSYFDAGLAFMFETCLPLNVAPHALHPSWQDVNYMDCWQSLRDEFTGWKLLEEQQTKESKDDEDEDV